MEISRALITGAGSGFGRGLALELADRGHDVLAGVLSDEEGAGYDDVDRVTALLRALSEARVPDKDRSARFRCAIVLAAPDGRSWSTAGECAGRIIDTPRGSRGFGYDPVFYIPSHGCTMAELPPEEKNRVSHRALALEKALMVIEEYLMNRGEAQPDPARGEPEPPGGEQQ